MEEQPQLSRLNPMRTRLGGMATMATLGAGFGEAAYVFSSIGHQAGPIKCGVVGALIWGGGMYKLLLSKEYDRLDHNEYPQ